MAEKLFLSTEELRRIGLSEPMVRTFLKLAEFVDTQNRLADAETDITDLNAALAAKVPNSRQIISGGGLTGGGDLSADRTLAVGAGAGIIVNADDVAIDTTAEAERIRDIIGAALVAGANVTITVNDGADTITIAATDTTYTDEQARDAIGAALVAGDNITITVNDGADTITIDAESGGGGGGGAVASPFAVVKGTTAGTPGTGAFTPNAAASGFRAWTTVPTGWLGLVKYEEDDDWEISWSYWNGTTLSRGSSQLYASSTGSQISFTSASTAALLLGIDNFLVPTLDWRGFIVTQGRSTSIAAGTSTTGSTGGASFSDAAYINAQKRTRYTSATTANALAGFSDSDYQLVRSATSTFGGFAYRAVFGTAQIPTGPRLFAGLSSDNALGSNEPSAWVQNTVAFGKDSTDSNIHFLSNDASGAGAKTDTGIALAAGGWYNAIIWAEPGQSVINGLLARRDTGAVYYGTRSSNLPTAGAPMAPQLLGGLSATTGTAIQMEIASMLHRAPFYSE